MMAGIQLGEVHIFLVAALRWTCYCLIDDIMTYATMYLLTLLAYRATLHCTAPRRPGMNLLWGLHRRNFDGFPDGKLFVVVAATRGSSRKSIERCGQTYHRTRVRAHALMTVMCSIMNVCGDE